MFAGLPRSCGEATAVSASSNVLDTDVHAESLPFEILRLRHVHVVRSRASDFVVGPTCRRVIAI